MPATLRERRLAILFLHKVRDASLVGADKADAFLAALSVNDRVVHVHAGRPVLVHLGRLGLPRFLFVPQKFVPALVFRRETVVLNVIFVLLHVITAACIDALLVVSVRIVVGVVAVFPLLLPDHTPKLSSGDHIVALLLHLLIQLMKGARLL